MSGWDGVWFHFGFSFLQVNCLFSDRKVIKNKKIFLTPTLSEGTRESRVVYSQQVLKCHWCGPQIFSFNSRQCGGRFQILKIFRSIAWPVFWTIQLRTAGSKSKSRKLRIASAFDWLKNDHEKRILVPWKIPNFEHNFYKKIIKLKVISSCLRLQQLSRSKSVSPKVDFQYFLKYNLDIF